MYILESNFPEGLHRLTYWIYFSYEISEAERDSPLHELDDCSIKVEKSQVTGSRSWLQKSFSSEISLDRISR